MFGEQEDDIQILKIANWKLIGHKIFDNFFHFYSKKVLTALSATENTKYKSIFFQTDKLSDL